MLVLPESWMMADDTNGPTNDDVLPMMEKTAKKRNWSVSAAPRGPEQTHLLAPGHDFRDHRLRDGVPRAHEDAVERLVSPKFPHVVKAELGLSDTDHAPRAEDQDPECVEEQHRLGADRPSLLHDPEQPNAGRLRGNAVDEQVVERLGVVRDDLVLQRRDDGDDRVEAVAEEKVGDLRLSASLGPAS